MMVLLLIGVVALSGCGGRPGDAGKGGGADRSPDAVGVITELDATASRGMTGRALVEAEIARENEGVATKYWVSLTDETFIVDRTGTERRPGEWDDLAVGQRVQVWFSGPVAESFPMQATAERVVIEAGTAD
jgi:hypothetical protein